MNVSKNIMGVMSCTVVVDCGALADPVNGMVTESDTVFNYQPHIPATLVTV